MYLVGLYLVIGMTTGLLTGLFGGGSGPILIPVLSVLLISQGVSSELVMHLAVGTTLGIATIAMLASVWIHNKLIPEVKEIAIQLLPGGVIGTLIGTVLVAYLSGHIFKILFGLIVLGIAFYTIFDHHFNNKQSILPDKKRLFILSVLMGSIATCFGVGMGPLCVPLLKRYGLSMPKAIAIATFVGAVLVIFAVVGFIVVGYHQPGLPAYSVGYIYLPMLAGIGIPSILFARIGAKLTHKFSAKSLKIVFAVFLSAIGIKMII